MVSVCLPSDALSQHLPSFLGFSYLGRGVSLQSCSSKAQLLLLTLDEGISSGPPLLTLNVEWLLLALLHPCSHHSLDMGLLLWAAAPDLGYIAVYICQFPSPNSSHSLPAFFVIHIFVLYVCLSHTCILPFKHFP